MKLLHTADWHLGKKLGPFSRLKEQKEVLEEIHQIAEAQEVDAILIAGDLFDVPLPSHEANELFLQSLQRLSKNGSRPVVAIAGNHDSAQYIANFSCWGAELGIFLLGFPTDQLPVKQLKSGLRVLRSEAGFLELMMPHWTHPLRLLLMPYANEFRLKTYFSLANQEQELRTFLQHHWQTQAAKYLDEKGVNVLMAHLFVMKKGTTPPKESDDEKSILVGSAQPIYTENFPNQVQYIALGHLHRCHTTDATQIPIVYSGSPLAYSFSEAYQNRAQDKFVILVEVQAAEKASYQKIQLQKGKKLICKTFSTVPDALAWLVEHQDGLIELTMEVDKFLSAQDLRRLNESHQGIVSIIPKLKSSQQERQVSQSGKSMDELFVAYFQKNYQQMPNEELMALFQEIKNMD